MKIGIAAVLLGAMVAAAPSLAEPLNVPVLDHEVVDQECTDGPLAGDWGTVRQDFTPRFPTVGGFKIWTAQLDSDPVGVLLSVRLLEGESELRAWDYAPEGSRQTGWLDFQLDPPVVTYGSNLSIEVTTNNSGYRWGVCKAINPRVLMFQVYPVFHPESLSEPQNPTDPKANLIVKWLSWGPAWDTGIEVRDSITGEGKAVWYIKEGEEIEIITGYLQNVGNLPYSGNFLVKACLDRPTCGVTDAIPDDSYTEYKSFESATIAVGAYLRAQISVFWIMNLPGAHTLTMCVFEQESQDLVPDCETVEVLVLPG